MNNKVLIACYDCGEQTLVPATEQYQTRQICLSCKEERVLAWERKLEAQIEKAYESKF
jgi:formylmethanofuran dehydrogenase subunit E